MRTTRILCAAAVLTLLALPASAITYGFIDSSNTYSNVGAFIVKSNTTGNIYPICSGTLITPNVFLTASHCTQYFNSNLATRYTAYVSFDQTIPFGALTTNKTKLIAVTASVVNPNYNQAQNDSGDIGALILATAPRGLTPAVLPACGLFDQLSAQNGLKNTSYTNAGYGLQNRVTGGTGVPYYQDANPIPRMVSYSSFDSLNGGYIRLSQNGATGDGGTCFGDSGGPQFLTVDGQQLITSITITGDSVCVATNVDYRLDTVGASSFFAFVNATYGTSIPVPCH